MSVGELYKLLKGNKHAERDSENTELTKNFW